MPIVQEQDYLEHYGIKMRSGRYPWGSGENPYQRLLNPVYQSKLAEIDKMHKEYGWDDNKIAENMGIKVAELRAIRTVGREQQKAYNKAMAKALYDYGWSKQAIGEELGKNESVIRSYLKEIEADESQKVSNVANGLKEELKSKRFLDVGAGSEQYMGVSRTKFDAAIYALQQEGYSVHNIKIRQLGTNHDTTIKVLAPPGADWKDVVKNKGDIQLPGDVVFVENGKSKLNVRSPVAIDPSRVSVKYAEDGGIDMDGVIQIRRGVMDLDLGNSRYAQVRIQVGPNHYLKGMAMYTDDPLPDGVDIVFNTNKRRGTPALGDDKEHTVLKLLKDDPDNPFGATIKYQPDYTDAQGDIHQSALNMVNREGDWSKWSKTLASQFLSKQPVPLIQEQLDKSVQQRQQEFDEIMALTNPTVKQKFLEEFASGCDSAAVHLKAAAMPRQASKVILPFPDMKENEIYAPELDDGTIVVLVRYPHAGRFECPELIVNNNQKSAKNLIFNARDAVGINPRVAEQLSGADFDGDTVLVIPNNEGKIKVSKPLAQLADFDPKVRYKAYEGMPKSDKEHGFDTQREMGSISNLITDMTLKGADEDEIAMAVKHSMVVIDAEKHNLDWRQSYVDNNIAYLKTKWQGGPTKGASTLISKASSRTDVDERKAAYGISTRTVDPNTGELIDQPLTGKTWVDKNGTVRKKMTKTTKMAATKDATTLLSDNPSQQELLYRDYANSMKAMANKARKAYLETPNLKYDPQARIKYAEQVKTLDKKLEIAKKNAPLERQAQIYGNLVAQAKIRENNVQTYDEKKKIRGQALKAARARTGAEKKRIKVSDEEWEAIQAGAISHSKLKDILDNANMDNIRSKATPKTTPGLTDAQIAKIERLMKSNKYTVNQIARQLGVSESSIYRVMNPDDYDDDDDLDSYYEDLLD